MEVPLDGILHPLSPHSTLTLVDVTHSLDFNHRLPKPHLQVSFLYIQLPVPQFYLDISKAPGPSGQALSCDPLHQPLLAFPIPMTGKTGSLDMQAGA